METKQQRLFRNIVLSLGILLGVIFISPKLNIGNLFENLVISAGIGSLLAFGAIFLLFPNFRKEYNSPEARELRKKQSRRWQARTKRYYSHPTNIPFFLGLLWFLLVMILTAIFSSYLEKFFDGWLFINFLLLPALLGIGMSGFLKIIRGKSVDKFGNLGQGFWVYFEGILMLLMGWGGLIIFIYIQFTGQ